MLGHVESKHQWRIEGTLQQHAGMHFTLGLVELAIFKLPTEMGGYLVQPRILARTKNIDRGIVTIENGKITAKAPPPQIVGSPEGIKRTTISEEKFYEELARNYPTAVPRLKEFTARVEPIGVMTEFGKGSMILRWRPDEKRAWNLGSITTSGKVWTELLNAQADVRGFSLRVRSSSRTPSISRCATCTPLGPISRASA
jgi:hypothetical protein